MNRRRFLYGIGATTATISLAGCGEAETEPTGGTDDETEPAEDGNGVGDESPTDAVTDNGDNDGGGANSPYVDEAGQQVMLQYGETAQLSNGVEFTIHGVEVRETLGDQHPEERDAFVLVAAESENTSDEQQRVPDAIGSGVEILFGDQQVGPTFNVTGMREAGLPRLEGGEVQGGVHREGVMLYEVDEGFGPEEIDVLWQDRFLVAPEGSDGIDVRWTADV